jgi:tocopherol cyclase
LRAKRRNPFHRTNATPLASARWRFANRPYAPLASRLSPLVICLLLLLTACDLDQADPYDNLDDVDVDWPSLDPNRYHWDGFSNPFFDGWFFRVTAPDGESFAFIYGVQNPGAIDAADGTAFTVAFRGGGDEIEGLFPIDEFEGSRHRLDARIEGNRATASRLSGVLRDDGRVVSWDLRYEVLERWENTMGILTNIPFLPINWYVGMLRGAATGTINWDGETIDLDGAPIYQDKNWGALFPDAYVWLQGGDGDDAIAFAGGEVGDLPMGMFVWRDGGTLFEARTQDIDTIMAIDADAQTGRAAVEILTPDYRFVLTGLWGDNTPAVLPGPRADGFLPVSQMALSGQLHAQAFARNGWEFTPLRDVWFESAGVELGGRYSGL